jgi:hypothetical protein
MNLISILPSRRSFTIYKLKRPRDKKSAARDVTERWNQQADIFRRRTRLQDLSTLEIHIKKV